MKKFLIISIGVLIVGGLILFAGLRLLIGSLVQTPAPPTTTTNTNGGGSYSTGVTNGGGGGTTPVSVVTSSSTSGTVQGPTIPFTTVGGQTIQAKDFRMSPDYHKDPANEGLYYLGYHYSGGAPDPTASENPPYVVGYVAATQYFNITLLQEPIADTRKQVESYLEDLMGLSQEQMCQLDYTVAVPNSVNQIYAGQDLRFSFCPGAIAI